MFCSQVRMGRDPELTGWIIVSGSISQLSEHLAGILACQLAGQFS